MEIKQRNRLSNSLKLAPILLLIIAGFFSYLSKTSSNYLTLLAFIGCSIFAVMNFHKIPNYLKVAFLVTTLYLVVISIGTYSAMAAFSDGLRYLLPFMVMFYGFAFKNNFSFLMKSLLIIILINNFYQCITYVIYITDIELYYYLGNSTNTVKGVLRAGGITHSFDFFAFMNLMGFYLCYQYYNKKQAYIFVVFLLLSLSFKYLILFALLLVYLKQYKGILLIALLSLVIVCSSTTLRNKIQAGVAEKYNRFLVDHNSPRPESYRVLKEHIVSNSIFHAEGVGVFGGPASMKYDSGYYDEVSFDWHGREFATTDTYYPHLFIELGLIQGLIYLIFVFLPFILEGKYLKKITFVIVSFLFSSIFSFSLNSFIFLVFSLVLIYPLIHYEKNIKKAQVS